MIWSIVQIALFVSSSDALQPGWLVEYLRRMDATRIREMQSNLVKVIALSTSYCTYSLESYSVLMTNNLPVIHSQFSRHFLYSSPAQPLGPEDLTWRMVISLTLLIFLAVASMVHGYLYHEIGYIVLYLSVQIHDISVT